MPEDKWAQKDILKAEKVLKKFSRQDVFYGRLVFWSAIFVVVIANLLVSVILIPFLAVLNKWFLDLILVMMALVMGFIYNFLITNIGHLEDHHHILAAIIVPVIAVANVFFVVQIANMMIESVQIANARQNPWIIGILYGGFFILPYVVARLRKVYK